MSQKKASGTRSKASKENEDKREYSGELSKELIQELQLIPNPDDYYKKLADMLRKTDCNVNARNSIELDLYFNALKFGGDWGFSAEKLYHLYLLVKQLHQHATQTTSTLESSFQLFKEELTNLSILRHRSQITKCSQPKQMPTIPPLPLAQLQQQQSSPSTKRRENKQQDVQDAENDAKQVTKDSSQQIQALQQPVFSVEEAKLITDYMTRGYFQHFKLYQFVFQEEQNIETLEVSAVLETAVPAPPLAAAIPMSVWIAQQEQLKKEQEDKLKEAQALSDAIGEVLQNEDIDASSNGVSVESLKEATVQEIHRQGDEMQQYLENRLKEREKNITQLVEKKLEEGVPTKTRRKHSSRVKAERAANKEGSQSSRVKAEQTTLEVPQSGRVKIDQTPLEVPQTVEKTS